MADDEKRQFWAKKFAIHTDFAFGVSQKDINALIKEIKKSDQLAHELWATGMYEARIITAKIFKPRNLTMELVQKWSQEFGDWATCDTFCMRVYGLSPLADEIIHTYARHEAEYQRRVTFATIAAFALDKKENNSTYEAYYPLILEAADDPRNFVKKAVSWALRGIGKRNPDLRKSAIACAEQMLAQPNPSAKWIARDVLKELNDPGCRISNYPRHLYG